MKITDLPDVDVKIVEPISIEVECVNEDDYLASVPEVNLNASGDTEEEAIANLQDIIAGTYRLLMGLPIKKLGPEPLRQLEFLKSHLRYKMKIPNHVIKVMCEACYEMNIIRARDGVPKGSNVTQEYWDDIINRLDKIVEDETGHTAHCYPSLYK